VDSEGDAVEERLRSGSPEVPAHGF
jgi:hypothetical protein